MEGTGKISGGEDSCSMEGSQFLGGDIRCMVAVCKKIDGRARVEQEERLARDDSSDLTPKCGLSPNPAYTKNMSRQDEHTTIGKAVES